MPKLTLTSIFSILSLTETRKEIRILMMRKTKRLSNYEYFLKLDTSAYKGKWIAIAENKVVAADRRADRAFKEAQKKYPKGSISLAKVPREETLVLKTKKG